MSFNLRICCLARFLLQHNRPKIKSSRILSNLNFNMNGRRSIEYLTSTIRKLVAWLQLKNLNKLCYSAACISQRRTCIRSRSCTTIKMMQTWSTIRSFQLTWACICTRLSTCAVITQGSRTYRGWGICIRRQRKSVRSLAQVVVTMQILWIWWKTTLLWLQERMRSRRALVLIGRSLLIRTMNRLARKLRTYFRGGRRTSVICLWCISAKIRWVKFKRASLWYLCRSSEYCFVLSASIFRNRR